jgi:hypothetical protein
MPPGRLEWLLKQACECLDGIVICLRPVAEALSRLEGSDPVPGYEAYLKKYMSQFEARIAARFVLGLGVEFRARRLAERSTASIVNTIARCGTSLKISRRARKLRGKCEQDQGINDALARAFRAAGLPDPSSLLEEAASGDEVACAALRQACSRVHPLLFQPRGRPLDLATATHAVFLYLLREMDLKWTYTWHTGKERFTDLRTVATCEAWGRFNRACEPLFNPRPAWRLVNATD